MTVAVEDEQFDYGSDFSAGEEKLIKTLVDSVFLDKDSNAYLHVVGQGNVPSIPNDPEKTSKESSCSEVAYEHSEINVHAPTEIKTDHECSTDPGSSLARSPLKLFRSKGPRNFSVSDLVIPAWCELKYWYKLSTHTEGKKTIQMTRGTQIHEKLEQELFKPVKIATKTKEDKWGIRLWNNIQGLKLLRLHGYTRELEVWGLIDQQVVCGKIDELSCTHSSLVTKDFANAVATEKPLASQEPPSQPSNVTNNVLETRDIGPSNPHKDYKVYLCDVKTRGTQVFHSKSSIRPTKLQLMLYHRLISALISGDVDFEVLATRYHLDQKKLFSDSFLAQVINLNQEAHDLPLDKESGLDIESSSTEDHASIICAHNNLSSLWSLMIENFRLAFPNGTASLGNTLKIEYRSQTDGKIIGKKYFSMDDKYLTSYIEHTMPWWKGEREAEGVSEDEAYKCKSCDFVETCEWRLKKVEQALERARAKRKNPEE